MPKEINTAILRTAVSQNEEHDADEIIKLEMLELIKRDKGMANNAPLDEFSESELNAAKDLLETESKFVCKSMDHGDYEKAHSKIWYEMQKEAFFVPSKKMYGRFSKASTSAKI